MKHNLAHCVELELFPFNLKIPHFVAVPTLPDNVVRFAQVLRQGNEYTTGISLCFQPERVGICIYFGVDVDRQNYESFGHVVGEQL